MSNPCQTKKFYDTEFEATIKAAKTEVMLGVAMEVYKCGRHWHLTHADPSLRGKHPKPVYPTYCNLCHCHMRQGRWPKHILTPGHRVKAQRRDL